MGGKTWDSEGGTPMVRGTPVGGSCCAVFYGVGAPGIVGDTLAVLPVGS